MINKQEAQLEKFNKNVVYMRRKERKQIKIETKSVNKFQDESDGRREMVDGRRETEGRHILFSDQLPVASCQ